MPRTLPRVLAATLCLLTWLSGHPAHAANPALRSAERLPSSPSQELSRPHTATPNQNRAAPLHRAPATTVDPQVDSKLALEVVLALEGFSSTDMGFRSAGSTSSQQASLYLYDLMQKRLGLSQVALEPIPVDAWELREAWLEVPGIGRLPAAAFGGSPGSEGELTAELVDVGDGFRQNYEGLDARGKLVLANWVGNTFWIDALVSEAYTHGAIGVVATTIDSDLGQQPEALQSHDAAYRPWWPPVISVSPNAGLELRRALLVDRVMATLYADIEVTPREAGGTGYNVVGVIPGQHVGTASEELVILAAHSDAWFYGGTDDAVGVGVVISLADALQKAYRAVGTRPERTLVFTIHDAEEYGIQNTFYDWCYGAWYQVTHTHPEWVGKTAAYLNFEFLAIEELPLIISGVPELSGLGQQVLADHSNALPAGSLMAPALTTWAEHWTFSAAGIPSLSLQTVTLDWMSEYYHTQYDTHEFINQSSLQAILELSADLTLRATTSSLVPLDLNLAARALQRRIQGRAPAGLDQLAALYARYGWDTAPNLERLIRAANAFERQTRSLKRALAQASPADPGAVNRQLLEVEAQLGQSLVSVGVSGLSWYPYQQPAKDVVGLDNTLTLLEGATSTAQLQEALEALQQVGLLGFYAQASWETYADQYAKKCGEDVDSWGLQADLRPVVEVWDLAERLDALGQLPALDEAAVVELTGELRQAMLEQGLPTLEASLSGLWQALEQVNKKLETLTGSLRSEAAFQAVR